VKQADSRRQKSTDTQTSQCVITIVGSGIGALSTLQQMLHHKKLGPLNQENGIIQNLSYRPIIASTMTPLCYRMLFQAQNVP